MKFQHANGRFSDRAQAIAWQQNAIGQWNDLLFVWHFLAGPGYADQRAGMESSRRTAAYLLKSRGWFAGDIVEMHDYGVSSGWIKDGALNGFKLPAEQPRRKGRDFASADPIGEWIPPPQLPRQFAAPVARTAEERAAQVEVLDTTEPTLTVQEEFLNT